MDLYYVTKEESINRLLSIIWFNLSRKESTKELKEIFKDVLEKIKQRDRAKTIEYLELILCMIAYTRDIRYGKGERDLTYMMVYTLYTFFPIPAVYLIKEIVGQNTESYGSWKDIPRLCDYIKQETNDENPLIITLVEMAINRLKRDIREKETPSNVAKWIPRENSKYGWLFDIFVKTYHQLDIPPKNTHRASFRKLVSNTPEMKKTRTNNPLIRPLTFTIPINTFVKRATNITEETDQKMLDTKWTKYSKQWSTLNKNIIPLVDVSADLSNYEYNTAIGIGLLLSENSILQNRMILFSQTASWISLDKTIGFTNMIKEIESKAPPPTARRIDTGFDLIKGAILETKMKKDQINNLEVVVISNFVNDTCDERIEKMKSMPNLTYWNISQNMTIPNKGKDSTPLHIQNARVAGSYESHGTVTLRILDEQRCKYIGGQVSLDEFKSNKNPIETIKTILSNPRYDKIRNMFTNLVSE
jgi:hypothetical protein